ncbi:unnamed protein product [Gulo gulo]|uniref:Uncharacterized protein n=1 Tax=Gulo gulo TaxID=48420 RepID=A0A9X9Q717_GULGU|nr:unnamed protein product [Gulo gulo]
MTFLSYTLMKKLVVITETQMKRYSRAKFISVIHWRDTKSLERHCVLGAQKSSRHRLCQNGRGNKF